MGTGEVRGHTHRAPHNPHELYERLLHYPHLPVYLQFFSFGVIWPLCFEEANLTVTSKQYVEMLQIFCQLKFKNVDTKHVWF